MAYQPDSEQRAILITAEQTLVQRCMRRFGVTWEAPQDLPTLGPRNSMDWRYGVHDVALASTRGYQPDLGQQERYEQALRSDEGQQPPSPDEEVLLGGSQLPPDALAAASPEVRAGLFRGRKIPAGGCFSEARRRLGTSTYGVPPLAAELNSRSFPAATQDPKVRAVFRQWSGCMKSRGHIFKDPVQIFEDQRFGRAPHRVSELEISVALADIQCRSILPVARTWYDAEVRLQHQYIKENARRLTQERLSLKRSLTAAHHVLARGKGKAGTSGS
jgi:hypothetical protein